jgi:hypothetical protein
LLKKTENYAVAGGFKVLTLITGAVLLRALRLYDKSILISAELMFLRRTVDGDKKTPRLKNEDIVHGNAEKRQRMEGE